MGDNTTVLYITDNCLLERIANVCKHHLLKALNGKRLITVSQKPVDFGENVCVGDIGRSGYSISVQLRKGLELIDTDFVAIAEHDCVYAGEHFDWIPPDKENFYYNVSCWLLQYHDARCPEYDGVFSFRRRRVQSQLICSRSALIEAVDRQLDILGDPGIRKVWPGYARLGEPGIYPVETLGKSFSRTGFRHKRAEAVAYAKAYTAKIFRTKIPSIDIRHGGNITGYRRGSLRKKKVPYWGTMEDVFNV
jgi:hypothetical protein